MEAAAHDRDCRNSQARFQTVEPTYEIPCNNRAKPSRTSLVGRRKASLDEWQEQESSQENWEKHVADNMDQRVVSTYGGASPSKADRIVGMNKRKAANPSAPKVGAAPALWIARGISEMRL